MRFQYKIIFVTLAILVATLLLNSVLSLASFEKIYVASLVSMYEVAGKNLKRKIEQSLRFGKPLDKFRGMEQLLEDVREKNPGITLVGVGAPDGKILYHIDTQKIGKNFKHAVPSFDGRKDAHSNLMGDMYVTFLPLYNRSEEFVGVISLSFSREIVYAKLKNMASENLKMLWILMLMTSSALIFFLAVMVVRPIKTEITEISSMLEWPGDLGSTGSRYLSISENETNCSPECSAGYLTDDTSLIAFGRNPKYFDIKKIRNEMDRLGWHIYTFVRNVSKTLCEVEDLVQKQKNIFAACEDTDAFESQVLQILKEKDIDIENEERKRMDRLIRERRHLFEMLQLLQKIVESLNSSGKIFRLRESDTEN